jgi:hypothetical protein
LASMQQQLASCILIGKVKIFPFVSMIYGFQPLSLGLQGFFFAFYIVIN